MSCYKFLFLSSYSFLPIGRNEEKFLLHRGCPNQLLRSYLLSTGCYRRTYGHFVNIIFLMHKFKALHCMMLFDHGAFACGRYHA